MTGLLQGRTAIVYGGGGSVGGACARAFAAEGASLYLAGRTQETLDRVADDIRAAGGTCRTAVLDALDERAVDEHADAVMAQAGRVDISMNVIQHGDVQGTPMAEMSVADYLAPVTAAVRTTFLTTRAAARHMRPAGSGVILIFGGSSDGYPREGRLGGLITAFEAMEAMRRQLSVELGGDGIRVVTLRTGGIPETIAAVPEIAEALTAATLTGRAATLADVGNAAVFAASDLGRTLTAASLNISAGALVDR